MYTMIEKGDTMKATLDTAKKALKKIAILPRDAERLSEVVAEPYTMIHFRKAGTPTTLAQNFIVIRRNSDGSEIFTEGPQWACDQIIRESRNAE